MKHDFRQEDFKPAPNKWDAVIWFTVIGAMILGAVYLAIPF